MYFAVIGGGSWGTALACMVARSTSTQVMIYTTEQKVADEINYKHTNSMYLGDVVLPNLVKATTLMQDILRADVIIVAVPSYAFEKVIDQLKEYELHLRCLLIATKGLCQRPIQLFSTKVEQEISSNYGFIAGPNFAREVALGKFSSMTIAATDLNLPKLISATLRSDNLNITTSNDIITIQIAGIVKNIIAIKSGILQAQGQGENARAWLISQGLFEIAQIAKALGGSSCSLSLPAVVGDLVLTSYSTTSRNTKFGFELHQSGYAKNFLDTYPVLVEGTHAVQLLVQFIKGLHLQLPIINSIADILMTKE